MTARKPWPACARVPATIALAAAALTILAVDALVTRTGRALAWLAESPAERDQARERQAWEEIVANYAEENRADTPHDVLYDGMPSEEDR